MSQTLTMVRNGRSTEAEGIRNVGDVDEMAQVMLALALENDELRAVLKTLAAMTASAVGGDAGKERLSDQARKARVLADRILGRESRDRIERQIAQVS